MSYNQYKEKIKTFYNVIFNKKWPYGFGTRHHRLFIFMEIFGLSVIVFFLCCWAYGITSWSKLCASAFYSGDGVLSAAFMKAFSEGAIPLYGLKFVERLNAPFGANWNDWPFEEWIYAPSVFLITSTKGYYQQAALLGEIGSPYLGVIGFTGFIGLLTTGILKIVSSRSSTVSSFFWLAIGTISFAVAGGVNYLLGSFGFVMLRGGNRYSIVLLALSLLFVTKILSAYKIPRKIALFLSLFLLIFGVWDQVPHLAYNAARFKSDRVFSETLEKALPQGAMVFQLPVAKFPEIPPIVQMADYEHFRPYLHTSSLKFSYGTIKGRGEADWQEKVAGLEPKEMIEALERYGFSAIYINRLGYADRATGLCQQLEALGLERIANSDELVAYRLSPATQPELPPISPISVNYGKGFYGLENSTEGTWMWARQKAEMEIKKAYLPPSYPIKPIPGVKLTFGIASLTPRNVWVEMNGSKTLVLSAQQAANQVEIKLPEFSNNVALRFYSDLPASLPGNGDTRPLSFRLINVHIEVITSPMEKAD